MPTASEVLDVMDRLERDPERRRELARSYDIFRACVGERLVGEDSIDWLAQRLQQLHGEGLIAHGPVSGGVREPPVWDGQWIQMMHDWRVTADGRADAALHEARSQAAMKLGGPLPDGARDVFICHAGEDKEEVARPLAAAMEARGWTVWLDELELTVGDSLSGGIDAALARSRFGIVVLSRAFFGKPWPERELAGLAAKEVAAGSKVILPVWHGIDADYMVARSPVLADRLGASTSHGIESVADQLSRALIRAGLRGSEGGTRDTVVQAVEAGDARGLTTEIVTPESIERELAAFVPVAGQMLRGNVTQTHVDDWASSVGVGIRARGPNGEEDMFLAEGCHLDPPGELRAKVARLQDHILPKVRAGEWTR